MTSLERVVIVGGSISGLTVAETLRQEGFGGEIILIGDEIHLPYTRPPLSKQVLMAEWEPHEATIRTSEELSAIDVQVHTGCTATGLSVSNRELHTSDGPIAFDELVIATGTKPRAHPVLPHALTLRTIDDALNLRSRLSTARRVAVVGSGILGSELASAARRQGAEVVLVARAGTVGFGGVGTLLSNELIRHHQEHNIELALHSKVVAEEQLTSGGHRIVLSTGVKHEVDLLVAAIGSTPNTQWLVDSGLDLTKGIACDSDGVVTPGVSAVGDAAAWADPVTGQHRRIEHQSYAIEQAVAVAMRLVHGTKCTHPTPLFWSEIHGTRINAYGWFDPQIPLGDTNSSTTTRGRIYVSRNSDGMIGGIVGWDASPREFRSLRAEMVAPPAPLTTTAL